MSALVAAMRGPGAAQVSLAKLGDREALNQLESELNGENDSGDAASKLGRVGNEKAVAILLNYFFEHASDKSRLWRSGDLGGDSLGGVVAALVTIVRNPPMEPGRPAPGDSKTWAEWWEQNKGNPVSLSIDGHFRDPYSQCLARKVEWGFPDAILDLGASGDREAIQLLKMLTRIGDQRSRVSGIDTVRGRAQTALLKLGNEEEFNAILSELESPSSVDAVKKLQYIGGKRAVVALMHSLNGANFLSEYPDWKNDGINAPGILFDHDEAIASAPVKMVASPPDTTGEPKSKKKWLDWWEKNENAVQLVRTREVSFE